MTPVLGFKTFGSTSTSTSPTVVTLGIAPTWIRLTVAGTQLAYGMATAVKQASLTPGLANSSAHILRLQEGGVEVLSVTFQAFTSTGAKFVVNTADLAHPVLIEAGN